MIEKAIELFSHLATLPWLLLVLVTAPLVVAAVAKRAFPHLALVALLFVPALLSVGVLFQAGVVWLVGALDVAIVLVALVDLALLPRASAFAAERQTSRIASLRKSHHVTLTVSNLRRRGFFLWVRDDVPQQFEADPAQFALRLAGRSRATLHYEMKASVRGSFELAVVHLCVRSPLGMWRQFVRCPAGSVVNVYPDMKQLSEYAVLARTNRLSLMGVRRTRRIGQDNEFERLRDFTRDDNYKHIDWRTTARRNKLTVKDFQANQSQRIVFLVDCGRMMTNEAAGLSLLDHALNAVLMLSYVALRQGDSVGLICFSDQIHTFVPIRGGMKQMNHLLHASFDRFPQHVESRYDQAFFYLSSRCRKRSLVVLISNIIDDVNAHQIGQHLSTLTGRHLPLGVLLRDRRIFEAADDPATRDHGSYRAAAAAEILTWRHRVLADLTHKGVLSLDVFPEDLTAPLVNCYMEVKARHLL